MSGEGGAWSSPRARRDAFDLAEMAAGVRRVADLEGQGYEDVSEALLDLIAAQARLCSILAGWVGRRAAIDRGDVLRDLRIETEVQIAQTALEGLDDGLPFDA